MNLNYLNHTFVLNEECNNYIWNSYTCKKCNIMVVEYIIENEIRIAYLDSTLLFLKLIGAILTASCEEMIIKGIIE